MSLVEKCPDGRLGDRERFDSWVDLKLKVVDDEGNDRVDDENDDWSRDR